MKSSVTHEMSRARSDLRAFDKQSRFAAVVALTRTAQDGKAAEVREIDRAYDRPTPYARNAVYVEPATLARPVASFGLKDDFEHRAPGTPPVHFLGPNIEGGQRNVKGMEKLLQLAGHLPAGWKVVPGSEARLDQYGNDSRGQVIQVLSQLRLQLTAGYDRNIPVGTDKATRAKRQRAFVRAGGQFFVAKPGAKGFKQPGIYHRQVLGKRTFGPARRRPRPVFIFVRRVSYRRRQDWDAVSQRTVDARLDFHMNAALDQALATART